MFYLAQLECLHRSAIIATLALLDQSVVIVSFVASYERDDFVLAYVSTLIPHWIGNGGFYYVGKVRIRVKDDSIFFPLINFVVAPVAP